MVSKLQEMIDECTNIVFFGGAGVSTESGIPDFRGTSGLFEQNQYEYPAEVILSHSFFIQKSELFFTFYRDKMVCRKAVPNAAHRKLAELEQAAKLKAVITQNIDGLHQKAGSREVLELHGSIACNYCVKCHKAYELDFIIQSAGVPYCTCGGIVKPDVVLYEEPLDNHVIARAVQYIQKAELLIVGGTSLNVYPAAGLLRYFRGNYLVLINREGTLADARADLIIRDKIGDTFSQIVV